jgi:8-oxo-dGTP pyrophosphatase MutT (NUDIX family)
LREAHEEAGVPEELLDAIDEFIIDLGFWSYTTVIARTTEHFEPVENDQESIDLQWVKRTAVEELELHPRFGQNWPHLRDLLAGHIE